MANKYFKHGIDLLKLLKILVKVNNFQNSTNNISWQCLQYLVAKELSLFP